MPSSPSTRHRLLGSPPPRRNSYPKDAKRNLYRKDAPPELVDYCWAAFIDGLGPLHRAGKLGVVVLQFPKWIFPNRKTRNYLAEVRDRLGEYRGAVEFRNNIWMNAENREDTLALLGDLGFTYICVDEPQGFKSSVPPVAAATSMLSSASTGETPNLGEASEDIGADRRRAPSPGHVSNPAPNADVKTKRGRRVPSPPPEFRS